MSELQVWKYDAPVIEDPFSHKMPMGATVLSVGTQGGDTMVYAKVWTLVNPEAPLETRIFLWRPTGKPGWQATADYDLEFIGTVQFHSGRIVAHLFEVVGKKEKL